MSSVVEVGLDVGNEKCSRVKGRNQRGHLGGSEV